MIGIKLFFRIVLLLYLYLIEEFRALMDRCDWSSMSDSFVVAGITPSTIFDISEERLLQMKIPQEDVTRYQRTKDANKMRGKHSNIQDLLRKFYYTSL